MITNPPTKKTGQPVTVPATDTHPAFEIDPEFEAFLPQLDPEVFAKLSAQIEKDKHVDDLVLLDFDDRLVLGDGHNRRRVCDEKGIPYKTRIVQVASHEEAIHWIVTNQLAKRNLTDEQRDYFMGKQYLVAKQRPGGDRKSKSSAQSEQVIGSTAEAIAEKHGVSPVTVRRNAEYAKGVDVVGEEEGAEEKTRILGGKSKKTKAEVISRGRRTGKAKKQERSAPKTKQTTSKSTSGTDDQTVLELMAKVVELIKARAKKHGKSEGSVCCKEATQAMLVAFKKWTEDVK